MIRPRFRGKRLPRTKVPKMRKAPVMTEEEKQGADYLTRVWDRLQEHGKSRDKLKPRGRKEVY